MQPEIGGRRGVRKAIDEPLKRIHQPLVACTANQKLLYLRRGYWAQSMWPIELTHERIQVAGAEPRRHALQKTVASRVRTRRGDSHPRITGAEFDGRRCEIERQRVRWIVHVVHGPSLVPPAVGLAGWLDAAGPTTL